MFRQIYGKTIGRYFGGRALYRTFDEIHLEGFCDFAHELSVELDLGSRSLALCLEEPANQSLLIFSLLDG